MIVYKYRNFTEQTVKIIVKRTNYFASRRSLNDPFDCMPFLLNDLESDLIYDLHFEMMKNRSNGDSYQAEKYSRFIRSDKNAFDRAENDIKGMFNETLDRFGIFSASKRYDSPLMWSHYANEHTGLCIGYEKLDKATKRLTTGEDHWNAKDITYSKDRIILFSQLYSLLVEGATGIQSEIFGKAFLTKAPDWDYEEEVRFLKYDGAGEDIIGARICSITLGLKCDAAITQAVKNIVGEDESIEVFRVIEDPHGEYSLVREPI